MRAVVWLCVLGLVLSLAVSAPADKPAQALEKLQATSLVAVNSMDDSFKTLSLFYRPFKSLFYIFEGILWTRIFAHTFSFGFQRCMDATQPVMYRPIFTTHPSEAIQVKPWWIDGQSERSSGGAEIKAISKPLGVQLLVRDPSISNKIKQRLGGRLFYAYPVSNDDNELFRRRLRINAPKVIAIKSEDDSSTSLNGKVGPESDATETTPATTTKTLSDLNWRTRCNQLGGEECQDMMEYMFHIYSVLSMTKSRHQELWLSEDLTLADLEKLAAKGAGEGEAHLDVQFLRHIRFKHQALFDASYALPSVLQPKHNMCRKRGMGGFLIALAVFAARLSLALYVHS